MRVHSSREGPIILHTGLARRAGAPCFMHGFAQMSSQKEPRCLPAHLICCDYLLACNLYRMRRLVEGLLDLYHLKDGVVFRVRSGKAAASNPRAHQQRILLHAGQSDLPFPSMSASEFEKHMTQRRLRQRPSPKTWPIPVPLFLDCILSRKPA